MIEIDPDSVLGNPDATLAVDASPPTPTWAGSVFANEEDVRRYNEARARGASFMEALKVGDNGVGAWGDDTTSKTDPIVALSPQTPGFAYNRKVILTGPKGQTVARIADKGPSGRIDLNPAAAMAVGHPGGVVPVTWKYADETAPRIAAGGGNSGIPAIKSSSTPPGTYTPIGSGESEFTVGDDTMEAGGGDDTGMDAQPPDQSGATVEKREGSIVTLSNGTTFDTATGIMTWPGPQGRTFYQAGPDAKPVLLAAPKAPPRPPAPVTQTDADGNVFMIDPVSGKSRKVTPEGFKLKGSDEALTSPQKLALRNEQRDVYNEQVTTKMMYGKGPNGLFSIKEKLDGLYNQTEGATPEEKYKNMKGRPMTQSTYAFAFAKFNDQDSAVLQGEYNAIAERLGIGGRFGLAFERAKRGDTLSVQQMRDIQLTINTAYEQFKGQHFADLARREKKVAAAGMDLYDLNIPPKVVDEFQQWKKEQTGAAPASAPAPAPEVSDNDAFAAAKKRLEEIPADTTDPVLLKKRQRAEEALAMFAQ